MECIKQDFEYFCPQQIQSSILRSFIIEYTPISTLQHGVPIHFSVPGSDSLYLALSKSYLYVRARITDANGVNIGANDEVGPINLPVHSMFSNIEVELGGKVISDTNPMYAYRSYLETILNYNRDIKEAELESAIWSKDTPGHFQDFHTANGSANEGLVSRTRYSTGCAGRNDWPSALRHISTRKSNSTSCAIAVETLSCK